MELNKNEYIVTCFSTKSCHPIIQVVVFDGIEGTYRIDSILFEEWVTIPEIHAILRPLELLNASLLAEVMLLLRNQNEIK